MSFSRDLRATAIWSVLLALVASACASATESYGPGATEAGRDRAALPSAPRRYVWLDASCSDGAMDLASLGFERSVEVAKTSDGLLLTFDTALATTGCWSTSVWTALPSGDDYRFEPEAWVTLPAAAPCGMEERKPVLGELRFSFDGLEIVTRDSPWCRGLDAHFVYRQARTPAAPDASHVAARYMAHFARGDASALAALFATEGSVVEPFSRTEDNQPARHEGRAAIRAYFERAFASVTWHAVRVLSFEPRQDASTVVADFEYMDAALGEPLRARTLLVLAGGELFESEIQLVTDPRPVAVSLPPASSTPASSTTLSVTPAP